MGSDEINANSFFSTKEDKGETKKIVKSSLDNIIDIVFKGDKVIWIIFVVLSVISIIEIFSASSTLVYKVDSHWSPIFKHSLFLLMGFIVILIMHNVSYRYYSSLIFVLLISIVLLLWTAKFGKSINGAERWLHFMGFTIQPSEIAKISLIGTIAFLLSKQDGVYDGMLFKWMVGLLVIVTGIIAVQNLSTALLLFIVCFLMMFIGNVKLVRLVKLMVAGVAFIVITLLFIKVMPKSVFEDGPLKRFSTWQARLEEFGSSRRDKEAEKVYAVTDDNFQVAHAKIAIANGGVIGKFPGNSVARDFLPQAYSDFIYAIILEELGLLGGFLVLMLYVVLLIRAGMIARRIEHLFPKYLVIGSALMLSLQAFVNMAVAVNLIPVTGQPLPLISRGGTSTIITCAYFGLILSADRFSRDRNKSKIQNKENDLSEDHDNSGEIVEENEIVEKIEYKVIQI